MRSGTSTLDFTQGSLGKEIVRYGLPSGIQNSVIGIANVFVQSNYNTFSSVAVAGCGSYAKIEGFAFIPINAFVAALTTCISQNLGAGLHDRARQRFPCSSCWEYGAFSESSILPLRCPFPIQ